MISGCSLFGFLVAKGYLTRVRELREFAHLIGYMTGEVRYRREILSQAFRHVSKKCKEPFAAWFLELADNLQKNIGADVVVPDGNQETDTDMDFESIWLDAANQLYMHSALKQEDMEYVYNLGQTIGYLDVQAQEQGLALLQSDLNRHIQRLEAEMKERIRVAMILGIVTGILLVIVLL